jgi:GNAT superfamily N-acetyltransferase
LAEQRQVKCEIVPFDVEMLAPAGELFALRQQRQRLVRSELPARFENAADARAAVEAVWRRERASGVAAINGGRLLGYLIGDMVISEIWGRSGWVRFAGCALAPDADTEIVRDLYASLGERWVETFACFNHFAVIPSSEESLLSKWFALAFGIEQVHGVVALDEVDLSPRPDPDGVEIRRVTPQDKEILEELSDVIWRHQVQAPTWGIHLPETQESERREWGNLCLEPEGERLYLAFCDGKPVGLQGYSPVTSEASAPFVPESCTELGPAGTREGLRGRGIGQALCRRVFMESRAEGFRHCLTDWRSTNLLSSRFWSRQGFQPVAYRLARRVDFRIAWAGKRP